MDANLTTTTYPRPDDYSSCGTFARDGETERVMAYCRKAGRWRTSAASRLCEEAPGLAGRSTVSHPATLQHALTAPKGWSDHVGRDNERVYHE